MKKATFLDRKRHMPPDSENYFHPRPVDSGEYLQSFSALIARLDRHIVNLGHGEKGARDDLASVLRILINEDRGNDAIARLCKLMNRAEPRLFLTSADLKQSHLVLQIAGLPEHNSFSHNTSIPSGLRRTVCIAKHDGKKLRTFTWGELIDAYGNTFGSHLGHKIPKVLDEVRLYGLGDVDFGSYMLRSLGVGISAISHALLLQSDPSHRPLAHDPFFQGVEVTAVNFTFDGRQHSLEAKARRQNWKAAGPLVSVMDSHGTKFVFGTAEGGFLRLTTIPSSKK